MQPAGAGLAHDFEPGAIGADDGISRIETAEPIARQRSARFGEAKERPSAFALPHGEPRLDQQFEMTRDSRLRLAEDGDQFAHRQLCRLEEAKDPQPRLLAGRLETRQQRRKRQRRVDLSPDINISLYLVGGRRKGNLCGRVGNIAPRGGWI